MNSGLRRGGGLAVCGSKIFLSNDKGLFSSSNDGDTWKKEIFPDSVTIDYFQVSGPNIVALCPDTMLGGHSYIFSSIDSGATWTPMPQPLDLLGFYGLGQLQ
jgi:hypothetical protein